MGAKDIADFKKRFKAMLDERFVNDSPPPEISEMPDSGEFGLTSDWREADGGRYDDINNTPEGLVNSMRMLREFYDILGPSEGNKEKFIRKKGRFIEALDLSEQQNKSLNWQESKLSDSIAHLLTYHIVSQNPELKDSFFDLFKYEHTQNILSEEELIEMLNSNFWHLGDETYKASRLEDVLTSMKIHVDSVTDVPEALTQKILDFADEKLPPLFFLVLSETYVTSPEEKQKSIEAFFKRAKEELKNRREEGLPNDPADWWKGVDGEDPNEPKP